MASPNLAKWTWRLVWFLGGAGILAVYLIGLGDPLSNYDEPLYAEFVRAMERSGSWFRLEYQGAETLQRPPTSVAIYALVARVVPGEIGLRITPVLLTLLASFGAGWIVQRRFCDRWGAVVAVGIAVGVPSVYVYGRLVLSDPPFVVATMVALWATMAAQKEPRRIVWAAGALGAGFALKSFAAAVPLVALAPWLVVAWRRHGRAAPVGRAAITFVALAAPYFVIGFVVHGSRFWDEHISTMLIDRVGGELSPLIGIGGPGAYLSHIWRADGPFVALVLFGSVVGAGAWAWRRRDAELGVAATAAAGTLLLLSAISTRLAHYLLVFYPMAAVCAGALVARAAPELGANARTVRILAGVVAVSVLGLGISRDAFDAGAVPSWPSRDLGYTAIEALEPNQPLYALDFYAPALGYYADRPFTMLSTNPAVAEMIGGSDPFLQAGNVGTAPPWPKGTFALVSWQSSFPPPGLEEVRLIASSRGWILAEVRVAP